MLADGCIIVNCTFGDMLCCVIVVCVIQSRIKVVYSRTRYLRVLCK